MIDLKSIRYDRVKEVLFYMTKTYTPAIEGVSFFDGLNSLKRAVSWSEENCKPNVTDPWKRLTPKILPKSQMIVRYVKMVDGKLEVAYSECQPNRHPTCRTQINNQTYKRIPRKFNHMQFIFGPTHPDFHIFFTNCQEEQEQRCVYIIYKYTI